QHRGALAERIHHWLRHNYALDYQIYIEVPQSLPQYCFRLDRIAAENVHLEFAEPVRRKPHRLDDFFAFSLPGIAPGDSVHGDAPGRSAAFLRASEVRR